ncbi:MAG: NTP transferase domain-containing protein [Myxococcota bacterium]|nr:NTP transferase domain-containing protein [Myxococcota bacterium]
MFPRAWSPMGLETKAEFELASSSIEVEAFILVGGRSSRFGGYPKGLLTVGGEHLVDTLARQLSPFASQLTLLGDPAGDYAMLGYPIRWEPERGRGAVGAVYGALSLSRAAYCWIFACDLVGVQKKSLRRLLQCAEDAEQLPPERRPCYFGYRDLHGPQPLAGLWSKRALADLPPLAQGRDLPPLRGLIHTCRGSLVELPREEQWAHWNRPEDRAPSGDQPAPKSCR